MSKVDAVVKWINLKGRDEILKIVRTMNENKKTHVLIISEKVLSYQVGVNCDQNNVFTATELIEGLNYHKEKILKDDTQFDELISQFEPLLRQTNWFKRYQTQRTPTPNPILAFWDGEYVDANIQGMFEMFCIQRK